MALTNSEYELIMREYDELRMAQVTAQQKRRDEVYAALPVLEEIDEQLIHGSIQAAKLSFMGNDSALENLAETNARLSEQKKELMVRGGFPADYLELRYRCSICKDTGFIKHHPCRCYKQAVIEHFYMDKGRRDLLDRENFSTFDPTLFSKERYDDSEEQSNYDVMMENVANLKDYCANFEKKKRNLMIYGNTGVGKSFLTNCMAKALLDRGFTVISISAIRLFELLEKTHFHKNDEDVAQSFRDTDLLTDCDLLIIDDLGTEVSTNFTKSQLFDLIETRFHLNKPIVLSTNLNLDQIRMRYSDRISSRLFLYTLVWVKGEDLRIKKQML